MVSDGDTDSDSDVAFATMDFTGVNFDEAGNHDLSPEEVAILDAETEVLFGSYSFLQQAESSLPVRIRELARQLSEGEYREVLRGQTARAFFDGMEEQQQIQGTVAERIRQRVVACCGSIETCVEVELLAVAAFNLFLQLNYTGPSLEQMARQKNQDESKRDPLDGLDPNPCFRKLLKYVAPKEDPATEEEKKEAPLTLKHNAEYHNAVLSELAADGEWPCEVCQAPYLLLLARSILLTLAEPERSNWTQPIGSEPSSTVEPVEVPNTFVGTVSNLPAVKLWSVRACVAHQRLLQSKEPAATLLDEVTSTFKSCLSTLCADVDTDVDTLENFHARQRAATVMLEWGLAQHHFNRVSKGKVSFQKAMEYSGVQVEVSGAEGKRTKFQQKATAQMLVRAVSAPRPCESASGEDGNEARKEHIRSQLVGHSEDGILLEKVKFEDEEENVVQNLSVLDQAILLALCLDVKNNNPADGLTGEQMGAYLARLLDHQDDWIIYSTALLERAWLEFERSHTRERALLQMQALSDQHTNRLTITQSTFDSVEDSAPPQDRLRNLHMIVYPPRWAILQDLAERYAKMGVVTSAAELFTDLGLWDEAVECYRHAGKESIAGQIVQERLAEAETPQMWTALGDLTNEPKHYEKALELSQGRFVAAFVALGKYYFDRGDIQKAGEYYQKALKIKPLMPNIWFRLGTISMQLEDWETALVAFSEVVQQEPEEGDAWANVAAIHMRNKKPLEAYPALNESLKYNRKNWRIWVSKLYICIDLEKYDEAMQACHTLLDLKATKNYEDQVPALEEKCVRAIVGGTLKQYEDSQDDEAALDSARRTLSRVYDLLVRLGSSVNTEPWVWETTAYFNARFGRDEKVLDNLMKEYRALQSCQGWEKDEVQIKKIIQVVCHIAHFHQEDGSKESLTKCKFLVRGVINKIKAAHFDDSRIPSEIERLEKIQAEVEEQLVNAK